MRPSIAATLPVLLFLAGPVVTPAARAQAPQPSPAQIEAMRKLDWLVGSWRGTAEIQLQPGQSRRIKQSETIQRKLGGSVLLLEGKGTVRTPGQDAEQTVFEALAVISYDEMNNRYRWQAHAGGHFADAQATVADGRIEWRLPRTQQGETRYTIRRTEAGDWHEIGERSTDGVTWRKFIELTLKKE